MKGGMLRRAILGPSMAVLVVASGSSTAATLPSVRATAASAAVADIAIQSFKFVPSTVTVPVGTTVTWSNHDDQIHTVTTDDGRLRSAALGLDEQFSFTFTAPGTYAYHCALHPQMTARIIVK